MLRALAVALLAATAAAAAHVSSPYTYGAISGASVQKALDAAIAKGACARACSRFRFAFFAQFFYAIALSGAKSFELPKGNVIFNATDFHVSGAKNMIIQGNLMRTLLEFSHQNEEQLWNLPPPFASNLSNIHTQNRQLLDHALVQHWRGHARRGALPVTFPASISCGCTFGAHFRWLRTAPM